MIPLTEDVPVNRLAGPFYFDIQFFGSTLVRGKASRIFTFRARVLTPGRLGRKFETRRLQRLPLAPG